LGDGNGDEVQDKGKDETNSAAEVKKVWEGTRYQRTTQKKEKRERSNERALVDFVLPFSFLLSHSCIFILILLNFILS